MLSIYQVKGVNYVYTDRHDCVSVVSTSSYPTILRYFAGFNGEMCYHLLQIDYKCHFCLAQYTYIKRCPKRCSHWQYGTYVIIYPCFMYYNQTMETTAAHARQLLQSLKGF